ncbi:hypothetical protein VP01_2962g5 [Puccinia sorghi]|uniref:Uncharacterized protein n=1 Tax=Puccinia sorghi TaxID=27349 RepID=A0A0L6V2L0_9BASI|nr:hypothetical protein VP01_2962g5 [Puccinia sorghi]
MQTESNQDGCPSFKPANIDYFIHMVHIKSGHEMGAIIYFLCLDLSTGGTPQKVTSELLSIQMNAFPNSTQNQRILSLCFLAQIEYGIYDLNDTLHELLFLFIWIPAFQSSIDIQVDLQVIIESGEITSLK